MGDSLWSMSLNDVRVAFSELIQFYLQSMRDRERQSDHKLQAARLAQQALNDYLTLLNLTEIQAEIEQTQRLLGHWRSTLPGPFEDDDRGPG
jgi:hypothetical protein